MDAQAYYVEQSSMTDPGGCVNLFDNLSPDVAGICHVLQGLPVGYLGGERLFGYAVPEERRPEVDTCYIKEMLARAPAELQPVERVTLEKQSLGAGPQTDGRVRGRRRRAR